MKKQDSIIVDFDSIPFLCNYASLLGFEYKSTENSITELDCYKSSLLNGITQLRDVPFYTPDVAKNIELLLFDLVHSKQQSKITFALNDEKHQRCFLHSIENQPHKHTHFRFNITVIEQACETYLETVHVFQRADQGLDYHTKAVYNGLDRRIELSAHEHNTLTLWTQGYSSKEIASFLHLSPHTVNDYKQRLYEKFRTVSIYQLIRHARKEKFI